MADTDVILPVGVDTLIQDVNFSNAFRRLSYDSQVCPRIVVPLDSTPEALHMMRIGSTAACMALMLVLYLILSRCALRLASLFDPPPAREVTSEENKLVGGVDNSLPPLSKVGVLDNEQQVTSRPILAETRTKNVGPKLVLHSINGLRALLTTYIVLFHVLRRSTVFWREGKDFPWVNETGPKSAMQFFFVTSGYVSYLADWIPDSSFDSCRALIFVLKRFSRLCPAYYLALLISEGPPLWGPCYLTGNCYANGPINAMFVQTMWPTSGFCDCNIDQINWCPSQVFWFASVIMMLAFAFPLLHNIFLGGPGITISLLAVTIVLRSVPLLAGWFHIKSANAGMYLSPFLRVFEYAAGMLSARLCLQMPPSVLEWKSWGMIFDMSVVASIFVPSLWEVANPVLEGDYYLTGPVCLSCIASYITTMQISRQEDGTLRWLLGRCLSCSALQFLAKHSYPIYILQDLILKLAEYFYKDLSDTMKAKLHFPWLQLSVLLLCHFAGILVSILIQEPLQLVLDIPIKKAKSLLSAHKTTSRDGPLD